MRCEMCETKPKVPRLPAVAGGAAARVDASVNANRTAPATRIEGARAAQTREANLRNEAKSPQVDTGGPSREFGLVAAAAGVAGRALRECASAGATRSGKMSGRQFHTWG